MLGSSVLLACSPAGAEDVPLQPPPVMSEVIAASGPADWRAPDPENTLYLELGTGRVVIELAPDYAPRHVANIRQLVRQRYFDGLAILRSQDNYVVQWGDPEGERSLGDARATLPAEFTAPITPALPFTRLPDVDGYAPEVGFSSGFPVGRDPAAGQAWLAHCYGMVGAGRGETIDSGNGAQLYVVIGHEPRHLDRNITLVGRVIRGMELLSVLPRGTGPLGFYEDPARYVPIRSIRLAADLPEAERSHLELLRTDTETFERLLESRRNRRESWFKVPSGHVGLCNVPIPVRERASQNTD
ncbi:MAG TPA: peptidylprolyl isomerase [Steroidobacteraceae bacterium]|nr:peptidylprolyl isomerase [Steroidobacteraceae bacterium]